MLINIVLFDNSLWNRSMRFLLSIFTSEPKLNSQHVRFQIFFKNRVLDEEGYILFVRKNALQILIPKYGLEGTVYLDDEKAFVYDEEVRTKQICINAFLLQVCYSKLQAETWY